MKQTKITDYYYSENAVTHGELNLKLAELHDKCARMKEAYDSEQYSDHSFISDMGTLTGYVLALGDKLNSIDKFLYR